jgi:hypothetical protein
MGEGILLDNDVVLKVCAYRSHREMVSLTTSGELPPGMLAIGRFTLRSRFKRSRFLADVAASSLAFRELLAAIRLLDPTEPEIQLAAEIEERATALSLEFDTGESQLLAILLVREGKLLVTGDKRAVQALHGVGMAAAEGRIACLEQLIAGMLADCDLTMLRNHVCSEPEADKALTACFACSASSVEAEDVLAGLRSYSSHLRNATGALLLISDDLSAIVA